MCQQNFVQEINISILYLYSNISISWNYILYTKCQKAYINLRDLTQRSVRLCEDGMGVEKKGGEWHVSYLSAASVDDIPALHMELFLKIKMDTIKDVLH